MAVSNREQKRKHALALLHRFLAIWQGRDPSDELATVGRDANNAVLSLELPSVDLPLPYDEEKMPSPGSVAAILSVGRDQRGGSEDEVSRNVDAWIKVIEKAEHGSQKSPMLNDLEHPVSCSLVAGVVHKRSDNVSRSLRNHEYPVVVAAGKYYCDAKHAAVLWRKWRKYWREKQKEEEN